MAPPPFTSFYFDCDSTLTTVEGIDELCRRLPPETRREIEGLTTAAMEGRLPLADVYERRLALARPSRDALEALGQRYVERLVPHTSKVIETLQKLGKRVGVISGGLEPAVLVLAEVLGVAPGDVHAVPVLFDAEGRYVDFDRTSHLWKNHGKVDVLDALSSRYGPTLFVGDGVTDLEARDVVDLFVGYGGVVRREAVERGAAIFRTDSDLRFVLELGLTEDERKRISR